MATSVKYTLWNSVRDTLADLASFPGRFGTAWRIAAVCAIVVGFAMLFEIPESALSCYLVIYLMKEDGAVNTLVAIGATIAVTLLVASMIPVIQWTIESSILRIFLMIAFSFVFIFIGAASKLGEMGSIVALIIAFILSLMSEIPVNGVISFALRFAWEMTILPMFAIAGFSLFFGRWSVSLLKDELRERLIAARDALLLDRPSQSPLLIEKIGAGNDDQNQCGQLISLLHQTSTKKAAKIKADIPASYQLLFSVSALAEETPDEDRQRYIQHIDATIEALDKGKQLPEPDDLPDAGSSRQAFGITQSLMNLAGMTKTDYDKSANDSFFAPDAFRNPIYQQFALKTTLAAIMCYIFYTAINWQGIHTAMVTCYVASMGTAGDTIHKLALRISGCLIGASIAALSIIYLLPHMQSVGALMVLVFVVCLLSAWVSAGSEKISYAGVQIALAFALTFLVDFGPTTTMDDGRDRIIGILVGNFAVYLVSTLIWPAPVGKVIRQHLSKATQKLAQIASATPVTRMNMISTAADIEHLLDQVRYCFYLLPFEPAGLRPAKSDEEIFHNYLEQLASLNKEVYFSTEEMPEIANKLQLLSQQILANQNLEQRNITGSDQSETITGQAATPPASPYQCGDGNITTHLAHLEELMTGGKA